MTEWIFVLLLLAGLFLKHFVCDFPLQAHPWFYTNKGTYGHPGGLAHAAIHGIGTAIVVAAFGFPLVLCFGMAMLDGVVHYHIDFVKMRLNAFLGLGPTTSEGFWILLGADQLLHSLTYIGIVAILGGWA